MNETKTRAAKVADKTKPSQKEMEDFKKAMKEAKKPVVLNDKDFEMAPGELDVRQLSDSNYRQMMFRTECQKVAYLKAIHEDCVDIQRTLFIILRKGYDVEDIAKEFDDLMDNLSKSINKAVDPKTNN